jgi:type II secretory pathway pseudopilin PulG
MKKLIFALLAAFALTTTYAQISDADAKLQYQQAEDAYNSVEYYNAAQKLENLKNQMGSWNAKTLYLYLKCVQKSYDLQTGYNKNYNTFSGFATLCDDFFRMIDKNTYPADKYKEMQKIQTYFKQQTEQYISQKGRTPQDAVDFLNECFIKFPDYKYADKEKEIIKIERKISLNGTTLCVISKAIFKMTSEHKSNFIRYYTKGHTSYYDLSKLRFEVFNNNGLLQKLTTGETRYFEGKKRLDGYVEYEVNEEDLGVSSLYKNEKAALKLYEAITLLPPSVVFDFDKDVPDPYEGEMYYNNDCACFDFVFDNFDQFSQEFKDGNYAERIRDAFQFLVDAFPKKKEEATQPKSKF